MLDRRTLLLGAAVVAAGSALHGVSYAQEDDDDAALDEIQAHLEALGNSGVDTVGPVKFVAPDRSEITHEAVSSSRSVPQLSAELIATIKQRKYWEVPENERPISAWPTTSRSPDYAHLDVFQLPNANFTLTADLLRLLAGRNAFALDTSRPVVIFGLRGCRIADGQSEHDWAAAHELEVISPSHVDSNCVLGVWRLSDNQLAVFRASTIPAVKYMYMDLATGGYGTSLLPTGLYRYAAGTHMANKPGSIQRGALRIAGDYVVLRTANTLEYDAHAETTFWTRGAYHNIHAGGGASKFSCAGCQVMPGGYELEGRTKSTGTWRKFQLASGLLDAAGNYLAADDTPSFLYMLLTGREAALGYIGGGAFDNGYFRLRPGSTGPDVKDIQERLIAAYPGRVAALEADGSFGMLTSLAALLESKMQSGNHTSPIVAL
jgi:hypothetical protein